MGTEGRCARRCGHRHRRRRCRRFTFGIVETGVGASIDTGSGDDVILTDFVRSITGGDGADIIGALFARTIDGGAGDDIIRAGSDGDHPVIVHGGDGDDRIYGGSGPDSLYGDAGRDRIYAGSGDYHSIAL